MVRDVTTPGLFGLEQFPGKFTVHKELEVFGQKQSDVLVYKGKFSKLFQFFNNRPKPLQDSPNSKKFCKELYEGDDNFKGGTFEDLNKSNTDLSKVRGYEKKISKSEVMKKMVEQQQEISKRKRVRSPYDGEYDLDKKWEAEPFIKREKRKVPTKIIPIKIHAGFSWMIDADQIDEFGSFIAAITNSFENTGALVQIYAFYIVRGLTQGSSGVDWFEVQVKEADEYLPLQSLTKVFSSNWFRRGIFTLYVAGSEFRKGHVCSSLGSVYSFDKTYEIKDDTLYIYSIPTVEDQSKIIEKLMEAFCQTEEKTA